MLYKTLAYKEQKSYHISITIKVAVLHILKLENIAEILQIFLLVNLNFILKPSVYAGFTKYVLQKYCRNIAEIWWTWLWI